MTPRPPAPCHHELRPGTSVCLHCRRAEREATAARHRAILVRVGLCAAALGAVAFAGVSGLAAWKKPGGSDLGRLSASPGSLEAASLAAAPSPSTAQPAVAVPAHTPSPVSVALPAPAPAAQVPVSPPAVVTAPTAAALHPVVTAPTAVTLHPIVAEGRTELANGMYALRSGDTVTVYFDTPEARTRRPEKFEQIVRATLPQVHGRAAESILAGIAGGNLLPSGETGAPLQPISLRGANGQALSVSPQTRPGRDGPLVVAYRVTPAR